MASGGSSGRVGSGGRSFDFGSDDVLCSYDDYGPQDVPNGRRSDPLAKDLHDNRKGRPLFNAYSQEDSATDDVMSAVEKCMKKYADNLLRFLEGISGRLSQLEVYCYKLERSIGEFRTDLARDQSEADQKFKSLERHLQEVHRSLQIIRDKQELAETQKELTKLQLATEEPTSLSLSKCKEEGAEPLVAGPEPKKHGNADEVPNQHLVLTLPPQVPPLTLPAGAQNQPYKEPAIHQPAPASMNLQHGCYILTQSGTYYPQQMHPEYQHVQPRPQIQPPPQAPLQQPQPINQPPPPQPLPQYQQQWPHQPSQHAPQQTLQPQPPILPAQVRSQVPPSHPSYPQNQPSNPMPQTFPSNSSAHFTYSATPPSSLSRPEPRPFGHGGPGGLVSQPSQQAHIQRQPTLETNRSLSQANLVTTGYISYSTIPYGSAAPQNNTQSYNTVYSTDGSRGSHSQNYLPSSYTPGNKLSIHSQQLPPRNSSFHHSSGQLISLQPYEEMIEKAVSMGYLRDLVLSIVHTMIVEDGQPVDFNALLDRLNTRPPGAAPRVW